LLASKFEQFSTQVNDHMSGTEKFMNTLEEGFKETQFQLKEMKDYVDHFADNLVLNSQQITVDTYAGFSNKPTTLTEILKMCHTNFEDGNAVNNKQDEQLAKIFTDLDTKAPDTVLFNITTLEKKVGLIELHIQKEEEQGMGALRKQCEELSVHMQTMSAELADKIDRDSVGFIVHEKYEEIVRYLQDALQSSLEDENNFKEKADEIQEMVILLSNSKADRTEIANMQEMMVKSEALLKKVGANVNLKDKMKDFISKKELEALLANKVDRHEFEEQLQTAMTSTRRNRKLASLATNLSAPQDRISIPNNSDHANSIMPTISTDSLRSSPPPAGGDNNNASNNQRKNRPSSGNSLNNVYTMNTNQSFTIDPPAPNIGSTSQIQYQPVPVIAIGQGINSPNRKGGPDFGAYLKMKAKPGTAGKNNPNNAANAGSMVGSASGPINLAPGAFRRATESGQPGGPDSHSNRPRSASNSAEIGFGSSEYPYTDSTYQMNYADQSRLTDHLAYLHGPIVGGGFNVRNAHLMKGAPGSKPIPMDDVEGKGM
jgi:hypothetical protein